MLFIVCLLYTCVYSVLFCEYIGGQNACSNITVYIELSDKNASNINVDCSGEGSCEYSVFQINSMMKENVTYISEMNMLCEGNHSCYEIILDGNDTMKINMTITGENAAANSIINCPSGTNTTCQIHNDGFNGLYNAQINAGNTEYVSINGTGVSYLENAVIYVNNTDTVYINCLSENSCNEMRIYMVSK